MTDPMWMLMVMHALGKDYWVWDKSAEIEFIAPGRGEVHADFHLEQSALSELRAQAANGEKVLTWFSCDVVEGDGKIVARVRKQLYVRLKSKHR